MRQTISTFTIFAGENYQTHVDKFGNTIITVYKTDMLEDGFGNHWSKDCPNCGSEMEVVRPGKVQCSKDCCGGGNEIDS